MMPSDLKLKMTEATTPNGHKFCDKVTDNPRERLYLDLTQIFISIGYTSFMLRRRTMMSIR